MSEPENFLARWSRRKREAEEQQTPPASSAPDNASSPAPQSLEADFADVVRARETGAQDERTSDAPAIDLTKLPPIDSITAATDIRPFLAAGVPEHLRVAALRRAWVADPAIRDFVGIAENQWDFTAPEGVPGFGPLLPADDVRRLVAEVLGDRDEATPPEAPADAPQVAAAKEETARDDEMMQSDRLAPADDSRTFDTASADSESEAHVIMQYDADDGASQNDGTDRNPPRVSKRAHGSALPE